MGSRRFARISLVVGLIALVGCGGGGGSGGDGDLLPIGDQKVYQVPNVSGPNFAAANYTVVAFKRIGGVETRQSTAGEVEVLLTSDDGRFNSTPVRITVLTENHLEGTVTVEGETYLVVIDFTPDGNSIQFSISLGDDTATGTGTVTLVGQAEAADPVLLGNAREILTALLEQTSEGEPVTFEQLIEADVAWDLAYRSGPRDPNAAFGYALVHVAATAGLVAGGLGLEEEELDELSNRQAAFILGAATKMYNPAGAVAAVAAAPTEAAAGAVAPFAIAAGDFSLGRSSNEGRQGKQIDETEWLAELALVLLPALEQARVAMDVAANAPFSYSLDFTDGNGDTTTIVFAQQEAQLLSAVLNIISGVSHIAVVYQIGDLSELDPTAVRVPELAISDGELTPDEYVWPRPLGVRASDGVARGQTGIARLQTATYNLVRAWDNINTSNTLAGQDLDELFQLAEEFPVGRQLSNETRDEITRALAELRELFLARYVIDYDYLEEIIGEPLPTPLKQNIIGIDLPAFWNNPPADLRDLLPTLEVVRSNVYEAGHTDYLVAAARIGDETFGDWPDSGGAVTLGGLLSPGVDEDNVLLLAPISGVLESEGSDPGFLAFFLSDGSWVTDDFLPWTGARTFTVPNSVGGGTTTVTIEDNGDTAARATSYEEVEVTISTSDGVLNNTPTEVNWVTTGEGNVIAYIRGTATDTDSREVVVNIWLSGSGSDHSLSVTVTDESGLVTFYQGEGPVTL